MIKFSISMYIAATIFAIASCIVIIKSIGSGSDSYRVASASLCFITSLCFFSVEEGYKDWKSYIWIFNGMMSML